MLSGTAHQGDEHKGPATRCDAKLKGAKSLLVQWRYETWKTHCSKAPYGPQGLMPDDVLHRIASNARLAAANDFQGVGWGPSHVGWHGTALLQALKEYDKKFDKARDVEKAERAETKKRETAERKATKQAAVKAERERAKALKQSQPKAPRASRAKKPPALVSSTTPNANHPHACFVTPQLQRTFSNGSFENMPITPSPTYVTTMPPSAHFPPQAQSTTTHYTVYPTASVRNSTLSASVPPSHVQFSLFDDPYSVARAHARAALQVQQSQLTLTSSRSYQPMGDRGSSSSTSFSYNTIS